MARILYVEDDLSLNFVTQDQLEKRDYTVVSCVNGIQALEVFKKEVFDLCVLDVMLPEMDGFELAKKIRETNKHIPIIFLTARSMQEDKLEGLSLGADDYITKPFNIEELSLKIQIFLKRKLVNNTIKNLYKIGDFVLDVKEQKLTIEGLVKKLTIKETKLICMLVQNANTITKRENILINLWGKNDYFLGRSLDVFISKLRKYFNADPTVKIENIRGVGFKLVITDSVS
ncbi:response regulator transcription factor [Flavobacteriales bacterium]|nr:response regulator transcription factor [Flavobacteriales bacterium]MDG1396393.1 response regulator transcription factor [Flavobacteriales bacterium]